MKRILLVEDNELNREGLYRLFTKRGYEILQAEDGESAVRMAINDSPDLILMDVSIPGIDGYEATRTIRAYEAAHNLSQVPIIALTAHAMLQDRLTAEEAGCTDFETKPVDIKRLAEKIEKSLI